MSQPRIDLQQALPPLVAGLLLGAAGWMSGTSASAQVQNFQPQLVVRPASAQVVTLRGASPTVDPELAGRLAFSEPDFEIELRQKGWNSSKFTIDEARGMTTVRGTAPRATLSVAIKGDESAEAQYLELPKKTRLTALQGQVRLDPGRHELLLEADGYIPKQLSVDLKPGERHILATSMEAIPGFSLEMPAMPGAMPVIPPRLKPIPSAPSSGSASTYQPPAYQPPAYTPPAPTRPAPRPSYRPTAPTYRPPVATYKPPAPRPSAPAAAPRPVPRFTPVAPAAQPARPNPVPMFTPVGN